MDIAVIVPTHNRGAYLPAALDSIIAQTVDCDIQIIVIDDGSTDSTCDIIQPYLKHAASRCTVQYVRQDKQGVVAARNEGLCRTAGPWVAFLDSDDLWQPGKLERQLEAMRRDEHIVVSHTSFRYIDNAGSFADDGPQRMDNPCDGECVRALLREDLVIFSSVLARRDAIDRAAAAEGHGLPFAPGLTNAQDYDLLLRLARLGPFAYVAEPLTLYRRHDGHAAMGNLKRAFGFHCKVQRDFAQRWGAALGIDDAEASRYIGDFLYGRAESAYWRRDFPAVRDFCDLAGEHQVHDGRFDALRQRASRPLWMYKVKDRLSQWLGKGPRA